MAMTRLIATALLFACAAAVEAADPKPAEFAARIDITVPAGGPYFRVPLTADVYRYSRSTDLADLRLFNGAGELLPFSLHAADADRPEESTVALTAYPIEATVHQAATAGGRMVIRQVGAATTVTIDGAQDPAPSARVAAYLLDARGVKAKGVALELDVEFDRAKLVPVTVQASRDLKTWRTLAAAEPLYRLGGAGAENARTSLRFTVAQPLEEDFLRLTWSGSERFELRGARLKTLPSASPPPPAAPALVLPAPVNFAPREAEWAIGTASRWSQLQVRAAAPNTLAPVTVMARTRVGEPWRAIGRGVVYRIDGEGGERFNPPLDVVGGSYAGVKLVLDASAPPFAAAPEVSILFAPRELTVLARGNAPFVLAVGRDEVAASAMPLTSLIPGYERDKHRALALATVGPVEVDAARLPPAPSLVFGRDGRTVALWAVLGAAVLLLSAFAYSLLRKLGRGQSNPPQSPS